MIISANDETLRKHVKRLVEEKNPKTQLYLLADLEKKGIGNNSNLFYRAKAVIMENFGLYYEAYKALKRGLEEISDEHDREKLLAAYGEYFGDSYKNCLNPVHQNSGKKEYSVEELRSMHPRYCYSIKNQRHVFTKQEMYEIEGYEDDPDGEWESATEVTEVTKFTREAMNNIGDMFAGPMEDEDTRPLFQESVVQVPKKRNRRNDEPLRVLMEKKSEKPDLGFAVQPSKQISFAIREDTMRFSNNNVQNYNQDGYLNDPVYEKENYDQENYHPRNEENYPHGEVVRNENQNIQSKDSYKRQLFHDETYEANPIRNDQYFQKNQNRDSDEREFGHHFAIQSSNQSFQPREDQSYFPSHADQSHPSHPSHRSQGNQYSLHANHQSQGNQYSLHANHQSQTNSHHVINAHSSDSSVPKFQSSFIPKSNHQMDSFNQTVPAFNNHLGSPMKMDDSPVKRLNYPISKDSFNHNEPISVPSLPTQQFLESKIGKASCISIENIEFIVNSKKSGTQNMINTFEIDEAQLGLKCLEIGPKDHLLRKFRISKQLEGKMPLDLLPSLSLCRNCFISPNDPNSAILISDFQGPRMSEYILFHKNKNKALREEIVMFFTIEILKTVEEIHQNGFCSVDLSLDNLGLRADTDALEPLSDWNGNGHGGWDKQGIQILNIESLKELEDISDRKTDCLQILATVKHLLHGEVTESDSLKPFHRVELWKELFTGLKSSDVDLGNIRLGFEHYLSEKKGRYLKNAILSSFVGFLFTL